MKRRTLLAVPWLAAAARVHAASRRVLVLGGTGFVGPHLVEALIADGWTVTLFNRGKTNPGLFPELEKLVGDRAGDLRALQGERRWDAVIDTSAQRPSDVTRTAEVLGDRLGRYLLLSTTEVYAGTGLNDESAPTQLLADPADERILADRYPALRAEAERVARGRFGPKALVLRAGALAGPFDPTDRFTYWVARAAGGGRMIVPGAPHDPTQFLDVRDLADFAVRLLADAAAGVYNVDAPLGERSVGELVEAVRAAAGAGAAEPVWVARATLISAGHDPARAFPFTRPPQPMVDVRRALSAGLAVRPLVQTARDTLEWFRQWPPSRQQALRAGLTPEAEAALFEALDATEPVT